MRKVSIFFVFFLTFNTYLLADSPLTSSNIHSGYLHKKEIQDAINDGRLTNKWKDYLISPTNDLDMKIAVISAIVAENRLNYEVMPEFFTDAEEFLVYMQNKAGYKSFDEFLNKADGDMLIVTAYLIAMVDYDDFRSLATALDIAKMGADKLPKSYTANIVYALIKAQNADGDYCEIYKATDSVRRDKSLNQDMSDGAVKAIFDYMDLYYDDECEAYEAEGSVGEDKSSRP